MGFVRWEEKVISNDKGRRLVHYYLRDSQGKKVLAVVGREKSLRHMSYVVTTQFSVMMSMVAASSSGACDLGSYSPSSALDFGGGGSMKWKSRRELIDWLSSIVSDNVPCVSSGDRFSEDDDEAEPITIPSSKGLSSGKIRHTSKEFSWLGSSWDCKKKRKHYRSFCRNGITISVHDFVFVMAEDYKRLVAYVEDLYEDMKANKMVVVRWFHKVDEVGIVLPPNINDREIFFSLCLQDLSVECIDGLAAVLSAQDFDKFQNEARHRFGSSQPYLCRRQIDNDDVKAFDITQVQGYWSQELLRSMYATPGTSLKLRLKITHGGSRSSPNREAISGPKERSRLNGADISARGAVRDVYNSRSLCVVGSRGEKHIRTPSGPLLRKELLKQKLLQQQKHLAPGCHVEVLSQDSGIRGCWFRCVVIKRQHDKVKVRYEDVQDADDAGNLEEWILASRVASHDKSSIRLSGRLVVRPDPSPSSKGPCSLDVGSVVDAWWHDGWWEGVVTSKELEGKLRVYFPGEQRDSIFGLGDLRPSQEWANNKWNHMEDCQDVVSSLLSDMDWENRLGLSSDGGLPVQTPGKDVETETQRGGFFTPSKSLCGIDQSIESAKGAAVPNLSDVCYLDSLKWSSSRKRRRARELGKGRSRGKRQCGSGGSSSSSQEEVETASNACSKFLLPKTSLMVVDSENCKIGGSDPLLVTPMTLCSNLVMSQ